MSKLHVNNTICSLRNVKCFVKNINYFLHTPCKLTSVGRRANFILNLSARFQWALSSILWLLEHRIKSPQYSEPLWTFREEKNLCLPRTKPQVVQLIILRVTILYLRVSPYRLTKIFESILFNYANSAR
jgi:hypothetical protein